MLDGQAAYEMAIGLLNATLDGANLIHDVGYLGQGKLGNPASILMGDEQISYIKRVMRGFEINEETLAFDLIRQGGTGRAFSLGKHTMSSPP